MKAKVLWCGVALILVLTMVTVVACAGPAGPAGPPGPAGPAGPPGTVTAADLTCTECHNDTTVIEAKQVQYQASVHRTGGNFERNDAACAICHTSEGFTERIASGSLEIAGPVENPSPINCRTCHQIHTTYTDADFALRTDAPVKIELTGDTFDAGKGNLCASCHQPRWDYQVPGVGEVDITSNRWGPHHGPQAAMLLGVGGYGAPSTASVHYSAIKDGCPVCHMAAAYGAQAGGHTMNMTYTLHGAVDDNVAGCLSCHSGLEDFDRNGVQTEIESMLDELHGLLLANGIMDQSGLAVTGKYTAAQAGALWNYLLVEEDRSEGVHNPQYAKALLQAAIDALK